MSITTMTTRLRQWAQPTVLWPVLALGLWATASEAQIQQPDPYNPVDGNGVNLLTGVLQGPAHAISVGQPGQGGLSVTVRYESGSGMVHDLAGVMNKEPVIGEGSNYPWWYVTVPQGPTTYWQQDINDNFTLVNGTGQLSRTGGTVIYVAVDGTRAVFSQSLRSSEPYEARQGQIQTLEKRNGEVWTFHYTEAEWQPNFTHKRLQSVTNNFGYQIHFEYMADTYSTSWSVLKKITAFNNTVDWCQPTAFSCTYSRTWPSLTFTKSGSAYTVTDALNRTTSYNSTVSGATYTRPGGQTVTATWAAYPHVSKVGTLNDGSGTWTYAYSSPPPNDPPYYELATFVTDPLGHQSRVVSSSQFDGPPAGRRINNPRSVRDALNNETLFAYETGRLVQVTHPEGDQEFFSYDDVGALGGMTRRGKPGSGLADQSVLGCDVIPLCGRRPTVTDARGNVTDYTYDPVHGGLLTVTGPPPTAGADRPQTRYSYQQRNAWYRTSAAASQIQGSPVWLPTSTSACATGVSCSGTSAEVVSTTTYQAGSIGAGSNLLPVSVSAGSGNGALTATTSTTWIENGDPLTVDGPLPGTADTSWAAYDVMRQPLGRIGPDPDGAGVRLFPATRTTYNADGAPTVVEQGTTTGQSPGAWAAFTPLMAATTQYDLQGRKVRETAFSGSANPSVAQYSYDAAGRLTCTAVRMNPATFPALPASACTAATAGSFGPDRISVSGYDNADRPISLVEAYGTSVQRTAMTQVWTANSKIDWIEDANGNRSDYSYDGFDRLTHLYFPLPTTGSHAANSTDYEQYGYDANDNPITKRVRSGQSFTTTFDALNRITYIDAPAGTNDVAFTYDLLDRRLTAAHPGGQTVTSTWDALGRNTSEAGPLGTLAYQYDLAGRRTRMTWPNTNWVEYVWDLSNAITQSAVNGWHVEGAFAYDDLGRRTAVSRYNGVTTSYGYNTASQLTSLSHDLAGSSADVTYGLSYSPAGQVTQRTVSNTLYDFAPTVGTTAYVSNGLNQSTSVGGVVLTWDGRGNLTSDGPKTFTYDAANRLLTGGGSTLAYDPLDRLYQMTGTGSGRFLYDGSQLAGAFDGAGVMTEHHVAGPLPDEWLSFHTDQWYWTLQDPLGSVIALTDASGAATSTLAYDEYGRPRAGNAGRMQYTGQMVLPDFGLYHYKARTYHAGLGRFVQTDPVGYEQGLNLYAYVANDPVNATDPTGMQESSVPRSWWVPPFWPGTPENEALGELVMATPGAVTGALDAAGELAMKDPMFARLVDRLSETIHGNDSTDAPALPEDHADRREAPSRSTPANPDRPTDRAIRQQCIQRCYPILEQGDPRTRTDEFNRCVRQCEVEKREYWDEE